MSKKVAADKNISKANYKVFYRFAAMVHVLDNPAWNALISGNKQLSFGNNQIRYFDKEVSPFAAFKENTVDNFKLLYTLVPQSRPVLFVTPVETEIPGTWKVLQVIRGLQMVHNSVAVQDEVQMEMTPLTDEHVPQMMALAKLTNPGPFESRTITFGYYYGIFEGD